MSRPVFSHVLVVLQVLGMVGCCLPPPGGPGGPPLALALAGAGVALGVAALWHNRFGNFSVYPEVVEDSVLVTGGPYRLVRHPMYAALVLTMVGIAVFNGSLANYLALVLVYGVVIAKVLREERYLVAHFEGYAHYMARTWRLMPYLW